MSCSETLIQCWATQQDHSQGSCTQGFAAWFDDYQSEAESATQALLKSIFHARNAHYRYMRGNLIFALPDFASELLRLQIGWRVCRATLQGPSQ